MKTKTLIISADMLYTSKAFYKVRCTASNQDYLLTKFGTFKIIESDNKFVRGERVSATQGVIHE